MVRFSSLLLFALALACSGPSRREPVPAAERAAPAEPPPPPAEVLPEAVEVRFVAQDGMHVVGTLQPAARSDAPAVILVHQLGSDRSEWAPLVERLSAAPSLTTLAIDMRGHGESTEPEDGPPLSYSSFDAAAWASTANDVRGAVAYLLTSSPDVEPTHFAVVGSSIGGTAALAAAATETHIEHLVMLSPGRAYHGFDGIMPAMNLGERSLLTVVASAEEENVETAAALGRITHHEPVIVEGDAHGVALFRADPSSLDRVETFLREAFDMPRRSP